MTTPYADAAATPAHPDDEPTTPSADPAPIRQARVYKYGCKSPRENADIVRQQIDLARRYFNDLCAIERAARDARREIELAMGLADARDALLAARKRAVESHELWTASGRPEAGDIRVARDAARDEVKAARDRFYEERRSLLKRDDVKAALAVVSARQKSLKLDAREVSGVFWGTYLPTEAAHDQSLTVKGVDGVVRAMPMWDDGEAVYPRFRQWDNGDGSVSVQIQKGCTVAELFDGSCRSARIERSPLGSPETRPRARPHSQAPDPNSKRSQRRGSSDHTLWLRVGSDGRDPVWAKFPLTFHRPLPADAVIKWVHVHRRTHGHTVEWEATFTLESSQATLERCGTGDVFVEFGWRVVEGGMRVATWMGPDGRAEHLVLPQDMIDGIRVSEGIRAVRDRTFNAALAGMLSLLRRDPGSLPKWVPEYATKHALHQWRSAERLADLVLRVMKSLGRFARRADYEAWREPSSPEEWTAWDLEVWRSHEWHLNDYERNQDQGARRMRADFYRNFAARLARRYGVLVHEDFNMAETAQTPKVRAARREAEPEADSRQGKLARSNRFAAAPAECRDAVILAFKARGGTDFKINAFNGTQHCNPCGSEEPWDAAPDVRHTCRGCGSTWDQDVNHVRNMKAKFDANRAKLEADRVAAQEKSASGRSRRDTARRAGATRRAEERRAAKATAAGGADAAADEAPEERDAP